jgi:hypothetical protein
LGIIIVILGLFLLIASNESSNIVVVETIDLLYFIEFINEYFVLIILCGLLIIISILTSLIIINTLDYHDN